MNREILRSIWDSAINAKRSGNYDEAIIHYKKALALDPTEVITYYGLGKIYFLTGNREYSLKNYLISCHLSLNNSMKHIMENDKTGLVLQFQLSQLSDDDINIFKKLHPIAPCLLLDPNTPRHIGHSLILLDNNKQLPIEIINHSVQYRLSLSGKNANPDKNIEESFFVPLGTAYLMEKICWYDLENEYPASLY